MALPNLAAAADLSTRGVDISDTDLVDTMLAVASSIVRSAAQSPILEADSTVTVWATDASAYLDLPGKPITAVSDVEVGGSPVEDYRLVYGRLWRRGGWGRAQLPTEVVVSLTHGFPEVPEYIRQLVCDLAIAGMNTASEGARNSNIVAESIDDYSVTFAQGYASTATAMELPRLTRDTLRKRFGGGAALVLTQ